MEALITRIAENVGIDRGIASKAVEIILNFLRKSGPREDVDALLARLPGAADMVTAEPAGGGLFGGFGGAMAALNEMTGLGLDMGEVQRVVTETVSYARETAGRELVDRVIGSIPGLSQFG